MKKMIDQLQSNGFCLLKNVFTKKEIAEFKTKFVKCETEVHQICNEVKPDPYDFVQLFEKENIIKMRSYLNESIIETAKGRYDVRTKMVKKEFEKLPDHPMIANLIKSCLETRYLCDIGILVTNSNSNDGPWHR